MKKLFLLLVTAMISVTCFAQGTIRGKITDENGAPMIGVNVMAKENSTIGAATDFDGVYSLHLPDSSAYTLMIAYISYKSIEEKVHVKNGAVIIKDFGMAPAETQTIQEVV